MKLLKLFLLVFIVVIFIQVVACNSEAKPIAKNSEQYQCLPCGQDCDNKILTIPGKCSICKMELVKKSSVNFKNIQPTQICDYIKTHPAVVLLDVRTKEEFDGKADPDFGTLKNAINIPVQELANRLTEIKALKNKEIIVFCSHSHRSPRASYLLMQNGFTHVTNMAGGMSELKDNSCKK